MAELSDADFQAYQADIEILVDTLRQSFNAVEARYNVVGHQNALYIEISGLENLTMEEISEIASPILDELDLDFDEISLLPLSNK
jgi:ABC-type Zn uptake system ZnuABC Zn-binding protein ZnuA